jgi:hypothetical protein
MITAPAQADQIIRNDEADVVLPTREMLRDPYGRCTPRKSLGRSRRGRGNICARRQAGHPNLCRRPFPAIGSNRLSVRGQREGRRLCGAVLLAIG